MKHIKLMVAGAIVALAQQASADFDCEGLKVFHDDTATAAAVVIWKNGSGNKTFKGKYTSTGSPFGKTVTKYNLTDVYNHPTALEVVTTKTCTRVECPSAIEKIATLSYGVATYVFTCPIL